MAVLARIFGDAADQFRPELADGRQIGTFPTMRLARAAISDTLRLMRASPESAAK